jgi:hydroxypyruvate isomerase
VEFWTTSDKDPGALRKAIEESDVEITAFVSEPTARIVDPATHDEFIDGVRSSALLAARLNARNLIVVSGDELPDVARVDQRNAIAEVLRRAAPIAADTGIGLVLEPLNTIADHRGYFLDSTSEGLEIIRSVDQPSVRLLYDMYHSIVMGEDAAEVLMDAGGLVGHVHIADVPGRHEPGSGTIDWPKQLSSLRAAGYEGPLGLEFMPLRDTDSSLAYIQQLVQESV